MLAALCARPKPLKTTLAVAFLSSFFAHGSALHHHQYGRFVPASAASASSAASVRFPADDLRRRHSAACRLGAPHCGGGAASIWHAILPSPTDHRRPAIHSELLRGEGSWNAALDARPARWLHRADSEWLLFGVCACLAPQPLPPLPPITAVDCGAEAIAESPGPSSVEVLLSDDSNIGDSAEYRVTGVLADGRCLFRAIAHVACLRSGEEAPDVNRQRELADELRAQVVNELLKRRKESEWFIEGDFDAYVKNIQQPHVWGGEPELLMASHVLKTPIWVYMRDRSTGDLANIAKYGEEYSKDEENPINVLFHGYGHYDILETTLNKSKA